MFGMGFFEIVVIVIVAIIFLGPDKLPQAIIDVVKFFKVVKKTINDAKQTIDSELHISTLTKEASSYHERFNAQIDDITKDIQLKEIDEMFNEYKNLPISSNTQSSNTQNNTQNDEQSTGNIANNSLNNPQTPIQYTQAPESQALIAPTNPKSAPKSAKSPKAVISTNTNTQANKQPSKAAKTRRTTKTATTTNAQKRVKKTKASDV